MLFPTVEFALFFLAVLLVAWSLCRWNWRPQALSSGRELRVLRLLELELRAAALQHLPGERAVGAAHPGQRFVKIAQAVADAGRGDLPCGARLLQVHGILFDDGFEFVGPRGASAKGAHSRAPAAAGRIVFCLPRHLADDGRLPRQAEGAGAAERCATVRCIFPATHRRAHPARFEVSAAVAHATQYQCDSRESRAAADRGGTVQESGDFEFACDAAGGAGVRRAARLSAAAMCCWPSTATRRRSTAIFPGTPTSLSAAPCCSAIASRGISMRHTPRPIRRISGGAGTSRFPAGCATTSTFRWAARAGQRRAPA